MTGRICVDLSMCVCMCVRKGREVIRVGGIPCLIFFCFFFVNGDINAMTLLYYLQCCESPAAVVMQSGSLLASIITLSHGVSP